MGYALTGLSPSLNNPQKPEKHTIKTYIRISPALFVIIRCHPWGANSRPLLPSAMRRVTHRVRHLMVRTPRTAAYPLQQTRLLPATRETTEGLF